MCYIGGANKEVSALISNSEWCVNNNNIPHIICNQINNIQMQSNEKSDCRWWNPGFNEQFNLKSAWNCVRVREPTLSQYHHVWNSIDTPKMSMCLYLAALNRLNIQN